MYYDIYVIRGEGYWCCDRNYGMFFGNNYDRARVYISIYML